MVVRTRADLDAVERGERIGLILALEGVEPFGYEVATADLFWEVGMRMAGLTWNRRNPFADGAADSGGLSRLGRTLLARFAELGVILDLSHASTRLFDECVESYAAVSASRMRAAAPSTRRRGTSPTSSCAGAGDRDGVFGLMLHPIAIDPHRHDRPRDRPPRACRRVIGPDRVCLGGDWTKRLNESSRPARAPPDGLMPPGLEVGSTIEG